MLWHVKGAPLSVPLVTTGTSSKSPGPGTLGFPDTVVLYGAPYSPTSGGSDKQSFSTFNGARLTFGYWLDDTQSLALEGRGFSLESRSAGYSAPSNEFGSPNINVPFANTITFSPIDAPNLVETPGETGFPASQANILKGGLTISNSLKLWGADAATVLVLHRSPTWQVGLLGGLRYLELAEQFSLALDVAGVSPGLFAGQSGSLSDVFKTRNQFYGATVGLRSQHSYGPLSIELSSRLSLGVSHESLNVYGGYQALNFVGPGVRSTGTEGIFAQPSNSGRYVLNEFATLPEAQIKVAYALTPAMQVTLGYDVLYESRVVRPGDQLDHNLPKGQVFQQNGGAVSSSSPQALFNRTDFFAHGVSLGLSLHF